MVNLLLLNAVFLMTNKTDFHLRYYPFRWCTVVCLALTPPPPPHATYRSQWTGSSLVQVMDCHLIETKPLPEPMLAYCQLNSWKQISVKFKMESYHFHSRKFIWKCRLPKWLPFCPGGDELSHYLSMVNSLPIEFSYKHWIEYYSWHNIFFYRRKCIWNPHFSHLIFVYQQWFLSAIYLHGSLETYTANDE